jgi:D-methionine transport system substrate-binding protein
MVLKRIIKSKYKTLEELPKKAVITIPGDSANGGRVLRILSASGLIKLKDGVGEQGAKRDIIEIKKDFKIVEVDAAMVPNAYKDSDLTRLTASYATSCRSRSFNY